MQDMEAKKAIIAKYWKWGVGVVAALVIGPFAGVILSGVVGMAGLAIAGVLGFVLIQLAPAFSDMIANWRMKLIVAEANKNPIETMRNIYISNVKTIEAKDVKITEFASRLGDYQDKMEGFKKQYPQDVAKFAATEDKMVRLLKRMREKQKAAKIAAQEYKRQIDRAEAIYQMACAANEVTSLAGSIEKQVFEDIKKQVAFDSVNHAFNTATAELEQAAEEDVKDMADTPILKQVVEEQVSVRKAGA